MKKLQITKKNLITLVIVILTIFVTYPMVARRSCYQLVAKKQIEDRVPLGISINSLSLTSAAIKHGGDFIANDIYWWRFNACMHKWGLKP